MTGGEHVLVEDWCQQYPSHSVGALIFGPEGALYASPVARAPASPAATTASWAAPLPNTPTPVKPVRRPGWVGTRRPRLRKAVRSDHRTSRTSGDPQGLGGTVIRIHPDTGDRLDGQRQRRRQ